MITLTYLYRNIILKIQKPDPNTKSHPFCRGAHQCIYFEFSDASPTNNRCEYLATPKAFRALNKTHRESIQNAVHLPYTGSLSPGLATRFIMPKPFLSYYFKQECYWGVFWRGAGNFTRGIKRVKNRQTDGSCAPNWRLHNIYSAGVLSR